MVFNVAFVLEFIVLTQFERKNVIMLLEKKYLDYSHFYCFCYSKSIFKLTYHLAEL